MLANAALPHDDYVVPLVGRHVQQKLQVLEYQITTLEATDTRCPMSAIPFLQKATSMWKPLRYIREGSYTSIGETFMPNDFNDPPKEPNPVTHERPCLPEDILFVLTYLSTAGQDMTIS